MFLVEGYKCFLSSYLIFKEKWLIQLNSNKGKLGSSVLFKNYTH